MQRLKKEKNNMNGLEIQIKDLNLVLSGNEILEDINLTVKAGEIHCLVNFSFKVHSWTNAIYR